MNVKISIPNQEAHPTFGNLLVLGGCQKSGALPVSGGRSSRSLVASAMDIQFYDISWRKIRGGQKSGVVTQVT